MLVYWFQELSQVAWAIARCFGNMSVGHHVCSTLPRDYVSLFCVWMEHTRHRTESTWALARNALAVERPTSDPKTESSSNGLHRPLFPAVRPFVGWACLIFYIRPLSRSFTVDSRDLTCLLVVSLRPWDGDIISCELPRPTFVRVSVLPCSYSELCTTCRDSVLGDDIPCIIKF